MSKIKVTFEVNAGNDLINDKFAIYLSGDVEHMVAANDDRAVATYYAVENCGKVCSRRKFVKTWKV